MSGGSSRRLPRRTGLSFAKTRSETGRYASGVRFFTKVAKVVLMANGQAASRGTRLSTSGTASSSRTTSRRSSRATACRRRQKTGRFGRAALSEELAKHRPDVIIVMGLDLASHLEWLSEVAPDVTIVAIAHPSSFGFTYAKWVPRMKEACASPSASAA